MGGISRQTCPYCRTTSVAFECVFDWTVRNNGKRALLRCGACGEAIIREYESPHSLTQILGDVSAYPVDLRRQWPEAPPGAAPDDTPENAANFFAQGTSSLEAGHFDAAGMMFRKTVESATKVLDPTSGKLSLVKRIDALADAGKLTNDLVQWAHEARLGGNEAAHEDDPFTPEQAQDLRNFVENFLRYAFTLPSAVKRREGRTKS